MIVKVSTFAVFIFHLLTLLLSLFTYFNFRSNFRSTFTFALTFTFTLIVTLTFILTLTFAFIFKVTTPSTVLCTLPAASVNSQYTVSGVAKSDGTTVDVGSEFILLCDQGHTFKNENKLTQSCTEGLLTVNIKNECFSKFLSSLLNCCVGFIQL